MSTSKHKLRASRWRARQKARLIRSLDKQAKQELAILSRKLNARIDAIITDLKSRSRKPR